MAGSRCIQEDADDETAYAASVGLGFHGRSNGVFERSELSVPQNERDGGGDVAEINGSDDVSVGGDSQQPGIHRSGQIDIAELFAHQQEAVENVGGVDV